MKKTLIYLCVLCVSVVACNKRSSGPDVSDIKIEVQVQPFFIDVFEMDEKSIVESIDQLKLNYPSYLEPYSQQIIKVGSTHHPEYPQRLLSFLNYEDNRDVYKACKELFGNTQELNQELTEAFRHYKYYFPQAPIPQVYLHTSYFNESIAMDSSWVSVSVEKYLGADCEFYEWLSTPKYLRRKMVPQKLVPDVMKAMAMGNFTFQTKNEDVISKMIAQGKIQYFIKSMIPSIEDTLLFDYSPAQMKWCEGHEADVWASMVEQKHLYNTERMVMQKYVGDSPFTYYLGQDSPGRAAVYVAYKIIESYMKNNPSVELMDLINNADAHLILREARYRP
ncbi:gliding motility protein GldB [Carboxylicivirga sp. M1479]|uniref:gliding motility lipoprotein GldB n=1 Tax=Carboxylicivirga sp. M1479 TaxID=2594476 RepID=UPI0011784805|nr:gliding motility protein GldB [Carboxylicivirga sp. M1479]TRX70492.1 gliding motility protein GldB [Carboxylicivirga sp. M1479]